jgi:hypothetical protein
VAAVYTVDMGSSVPPGPGGFWQSLPCPAGVKWVLRDLDVLIDNSTFAAFGANPGVQIYNVETGAVIMLCEAVYGGGIACFHWEGRSVITEGQLFRSTSCQNQMSVNAVGFQLTLP